MNLFMKLGIGLYRHMLNDDYYAFAVQAGCTHVVAHLVDYFKDGLSNPTSNQPTGDRNSPWGRAGDPEHMWDYADLYSLKTRIERAGLQLEAIENLDPAHWHDILLDGPRRPRQIEDVKTLIRTMGEVGIPTLGYNFSLAGVCGRTRGSFARGGALTVAFDGVLDTPIPHGTIWNMVYDTSAPGGVMESISHETLWGRLQRFLDDVLPTAEQAGVTLAAHPDDPPMPAMRQQPRLVYQPAMYQRLIDLNRSPSNKLEFCLGTIAEMSEGNIYEAVDQYSCQQRIAYVHFRNVRGRVPRYHETFIDDGDINMIRVLSILDRNSFDGVLIPDHSPQMTCASPWHAGMAHTLGFMKAALMSVKKSTRH